MIRRLQLLPAEGRSFGSRLSAIADRIRDGLLRGNKVVPAVLGFLALLIFAWLIAGAVMGDSGQEEKASNQSSLAQGQKSKSGSQETSTPGVENRDSDSYSAFKSKDPFALPKGLDSKGGKDTNGSTKEGQSSESKTGESKAGEPKGGDSAKAGGNRPSAIPPNDRPGGGQDSEDFTDQPSPGNTDSGGAGQDGATSDTPGQDAPGQGGIGGLFNSGGDLPVP